MSQIDILSNKMGDIIIYLTVGENEYAVTKSNIMKYPDSKLAGLVKNNSRNIFIDRDGTIFRDIVNYLRYDYIDLYNKDFDIERQISFQSYLIKQSVHLIRILTEFLYYEITIPSHVFNNLIQIFLGNSLCDYLPNIETMSYDTNIISNQLCDLIIDQNYKIIQLDHKRFSNHLYQFLDKNYNNILNHWANSVFISQKLPDIISKKNLKILKLYQDKQSLYQDPDYQEYLCEEYFLFNPEFKDDLISLFD